MEKTKTKRVRNERGPRTARILIFVIIPIKTVRVQLNDERFKIPPPPSLPHSIVYYFEKF